MSATTRTRLAVVAVDAAPAPFDSSVGMFEGIRVVVVVPAYDEERHLRAVLAGLPAWVDSALVVDDASRDGTRRVAREVAALDGRVRLLCHPSNRGVGAAIVTGYREGAALHPGDRVALVVMAGDGQMSPSDLPALVAPIAADAADYVKGNRFARPSIAQMPRDRYLGSLVFSRLTAAATGLLGAGAAEQRKTGDGDAQRAAQAPDRRVRGRRRAHRQLSVMSGSLRCG